MNEKLIIKNFGPIKDVELDLRKINIFIGESGTGKSTVAKLLCFCKYFSNVQGGYYEGISKQNRNIGIEEFQNNLIKWGLFEYVNEESFVSYECENYVFIFENKISYRTFENLMDNTYNDLETFQLTSKILPKTTKFKTFLNEYHKLYNEGELTNDFFNQVRTMMDYPLFIYGERVLQSIFSMGKDFTSNLSDPLFKFFVDNDKIQRNYKTITEIKPLEIEYKNVEGRGEIRKKGEEKFINLNNSASGYMSVIPIVLMIKYYSEYLKKRKSFIIEEPELSIFPHTQKKVINFLIESSPDIENLLITTHSPYILTSMNNLLSGFNAAKVDKGATNKILEEKYWVNPDDVSAYMMLKDGTCEDIFDREENLIKADKIDGISEILNLQFEELMEIELVKK